MDHTEAEFWRLIKKNPRFTKESFFFVLEALCHTQKKAAVPKHQKGKRSDWTTDLEPTLQFESFSVPFSKLDKYGNLPKAVGNPSGVPSSQQREDRHITGQELCYGALEYALEQYGPLAPVVLKRLGILRTGDIGDLVYLLIDLGQLGKTPEDKRSDFDEVFDLQNELNFLAKQLF